MSSVVKNKEKPLLSKIAEKIKPESSPQDQKAFASDIPIDDIRIDEADAAVIESRRNELRSVKHGNSEAMVTLFR